MQGVKSEIESEKYKKELIERLLKNKEIDQNGCWIWQKCVKEHDYGIIRAKRRNYLAHRLSYEVFKNKKPGKKYVCHTCDNPLCINPDHLFLGDQTKNMLDAKIKKRMVHGENHYNRKLSITQVIEIRKLLSIGFSQRRIAKIFNVSGSCISGIAINKTWKNYV